MASQRALQAMQGTGGTVSPTTPVVNKPVVQQKVQAQPTITQKAVSFAADQAWNNPISPIKQARNVFGGLGEVGQALSVPLMGFGGFLRGAHSSAEKNAPLVKSGQKQLLPSIGSDIVAGVKNIPRGVQEGVTPGRYLTEDVLKTKNKYAKAGIGLAADVATDPLNFIGLGLTKYAPKIGTKIAPVLNKIPGAEKVKDALGAFQYGYKVPKPFLGKLEELQRKTSQAGEYASKVATPLKYGKDGKELPQKTQQILGDILDMKGNGTIKGVTPEEQALIKQYGPIADKTLREFGKLAQQQIKRGADPAIFERLLGKYYGKRLFTSNMGEKVASPFVEGKKPRLDLSVYQKRQDLPEEVKKALGEVKTPAYGAALASYAEKKNIATNDFFRWVAKKYVDQGENLVQLPKSDRLGVLSGRKIPKEIKAYVDQVVNQPSTGFNKAIEAGTQFFKKGKTIYSPKQLFRNVVTSQVQAFLNPSGRADSIRRIPEALKEMKNKGKYYQELKSTGEIGGTYAGELNKFAPQELNKFTKSNIYTKIGNVGSKVQQGSEEMAKLQVFINERKAGKTVQEAAKAARETAFNYQQVSPLVKKLRGGAVPFITYPLKAAALTGKTLLKQPQRLANIGKAERAVQDLSNPPNEKYLPDYLKDSVRLPAKNSKTGNNYYLDAKYLYPYGNMKTSVSDFQKEGVDPLSLTPSPFLQEIISQAWGKDVFTKKQFGNSPGVFGALGKVRHAAETFLPTPFRSGTKLLDAAMKKKVYSTSPNMTEAIIQELGLPLYQYNPVEGKKLANASAYYEGKDAQSALNNFTKYFNPNNNNSSVKLPKPVYEAIRNYYRKAVVESSKPR